MNLDLLFVVSFPLGIVCLLNALLVPATPSMKISVATAGIGFLGVSVYWGMRAQGWIEPVPPYTDGLVVSFILLFIGMYSVFGAPLLLEIVKRRER